MSAGWRAALETHTLAAIFLLRQPCFPYVMLFQQPSYLEGCDDCPHGLKGLIIWEGIVRDLHIRVLPEPQGL